MNDFLLTIKNPLTIIAFFATVTESAVAALYAADLGKQNQTILVWFIVLFPVLLVLAFFITLYFRPKNLYAPSDYNNDAGFLTSHSSYDPVSQQPIEGEIGKCEAIIIKLDTISERLLRIENVKEKEPAENPTQSVLDSDSLENFLTSSNILDRLDSSIAQNFGTEVAVDFEPSFLERISRELRFAGVEKIQHLEDLLNEGDKIIRYNKAWLDHLEATGSGWTPAYNLWKGSTLIWIVYFLLGKEGNSKKILAFLEKFTIGNKTERKEIMNKIIGAYRGIS